MQCVADLRKEFNKGSLEYKGITWRKDHHIDMYYTDHNGFFGEVDCPDSHDGDGYAAMVYTKEEEERIENLGKHEDWPVAPERVKVFDDFDSAIDWATGLLNGTIAWQEPLFR